MICVNDFVDWREATMQIGNHLIGADQPTYIIAEMSANHCRDFAMAVALVKAAAAAGADAIKAQTFTPEGIAADVPILTGYNAVHDAWVHGLGVTSLRELYARGGLPHSWHLELKHIATDCGLDFLSTPFSLDAARFLVEDVGVPALKIASGDLTFTPLLAYAAATGLPLLVSTGMATLAEVRTALHGPLAPAWHADRMCLLHCTSSYPLDPCEANLRAIATLRQEACSAGYSDHTTSIEVIPALAVAQGAVAYEKHLRLDHAEGSPDAGHSLTPSEFKRMVEVIRAVPQWLGDGVKVPQQSEGHERAWSRRSPEDWKRPTDAAREGRWV